MQPESGERHERPPSVSARLWAYADRLMTAERDQGRVRKRVFLPAYSLRLFVQVWRQWARDRCPQQAGALAFQTALSIVPLMAVGLALLHASGALAEESALVDYIAERILPVSRHEISARLLEWSSNVTISKAGIVGISSVVIVGFITANSVERIFNDIWRVERRRSLGQKFVVFWALVTIVPALLGVSIFQLARFGLNEGVIGWLGALASTWAGLTFANKLLPSTHVEWRGAMVGGLVSALAFELAKMLFQVYVAEVAFNKYAGIYGALGLAPILLLWIYYTWLVVLFGAEVSYAMQHLPELELYDRRAVRLEHEIIDKVNGLVAVRVMCAIVEGWRAGTPPTRETLARRFALAPEAAERLVRRLIERKLVLELDGSPAPLVPGKPPAETTLADVMAPFRGADVLTPAVRSASTNPLDKVLTRLEDERTVRLRALTIEELVNPAAGRPAAPAAAPTAE